MEITIPYNPRPIQKEVHYSKAPFKVCVFHRQAGKTTMAINELIKQALTSKTKEIFWYVAPTYRQAKDIVWKAPDMLFKYLPAEVIDKKNEVELSVVLKNGCIITLKGADSPDSLRGSRPKFVVMDEYGDMKEDVWGTVLRPVITSQQDAKVLFIGTPKGRNHFWTIYNYGQNEGNWQSWILKASESGIIPQDRLDEAKREMTEAAYKQEFECDFLESASAVFKNFENIIWPGEIDILSDKNYQIGVDLGKYEDFTVLFPVDLHTWDIGLPDRFNKIDWTLQKAKIEAFSRKYNLAQCVLDATGLGDPIFDDLQAAGVPIFPYKFTEESRKALLNNLIIKIEESQIRIPDYEPLINELKSMQYELAILPSGISKIRMKVPDASHDDCIMSLALSVWGLTNKQYHENNRNSGEFYKPPVIHTRFNY